MKSGLLFSVLFSITLAFAGERMSVAVYNLGDPPAHAIENAEAGAAYVFQAMDIEIYWTTCGAEVDAADARMRPDFIVRVRVGGHTAKAGPTLSKPWDARLKIQKVLFPDLVENHRTLYDFVFQRRDAQWPFPPVVFVDPDSPRRFRAIGPTMDAPMEVG